MSCLIFLYSLYKFNRWPKKSIFLLGNSFFFFSKMAELRGFFSLKAILFHLGTQTSNYLVISNLKQSCKRLPVRHGVELRAVSHSAELMYKFDSFLNLGREVRARPAMPRYRLYTPSQRTVFTRQSMPPE